LDEVGEQRTSDLADLSWFRRELTHSHLAARWSDSPYYFVLLHPSAGGTALDQSDVSVSPHRICNDQLYHYYLGDPLEVFMLNADGSTERVVVGPDLRNGQHVQLLIPGNTFHTARLVQHGRWFLGASTEWPGVVPADVEIGNLNLLADKYPAVAADLSAIAASAQPFNPTEQ
jgi:hypothetical protein